MSAATVVNAVSVAPNAVNVELSAMSARLNVVSAVKAAAHASLAPTRLMPMCSSKASAKSP